jgi:hypothetical protein
MTTLAMRIAPLRESSQTTIDVDKRVVSIELAGSGTLEVIDDDLQFTDALST